MSREKIQYTHRLDKQNLAELASPAQGNCVAEFENVGVPDLRSPDLDAARPIDVHARLNRKGSSWYQAMRQAGIRNLAQMRDLKIVTDESVNWKAFMSELHSSKLCFSPFGYGELCWRDIEAFLTGSVLVKSNMSHLRADPELYEPWVSYIPVSWDFSDAEEVIRRALANEALLKEISANAFRRISQYLKSDRFVDQVGSQLHLS